MKTPLEQNKSGYHISNLEYNLSLLLDAEAGGTRAKEQPVEALCFKPLYEGPYQIPLACENGRCITL